MNRFQIIILIVFIIFAAMGVFFFATFRAEEKASNVEITIWGSIDNRIFNHFLSEFEKNTNRAFKVKYREINALSFSNEVIEALANGTNPDIIIISSDNLLKFEDKILPIPYESVSERNFKDAFIESGEIFLSKNGVLGLPLTVDPMVTYWNRDILQSSGLSSPPQFWSEFFGFSERITEKDNALNITKSAVAMGGYGNIDHAKEILFSLIVQNGNPIVIRDQNNDKPQTIFAANLGRSTVPAESAVRFYTEFSNPTKTSYSWNRALPTSKEVFTSGDLAIYFGLASELPEIIKKNPNLNFDVALFPQSSESNIKKVHGDLTALAILKRSKNANLAIRVASSLVGEENIKSLSLITGLPPVRRSLLSRPPGLGAEDLFYRSALITQSFLDPNKEATDSIFQKMIENILSGRERVIEAVRRSDSELKTVIKNI
jgi:ABC-type glycerol-3-phosphate transport system substrate-binding protein